MQLRSSYLDSIHWLSRVLFQSVPPSPFSECFSIQSSSSAISKQFYPFNSLHKLIFTRVCFFQPFPSVLEQLQSKSSAVSEHLPHLNSLPELKLAPISFYLPFLRNQSSFRAFSVQFQSSHWNFQFTFWIELYFNLGLGLLQHSEQFQCSFRAVSVRFRSSFRAVIQILNLLSKLSFISILPFAF